MIANAERAVLGMALKDVDNLYKFIELKILPQHFELPEHQKIWATILKLDREGIVPDLAAVGTHLLDLCNDLISLNEDAPNQSPEFYGNEVLNAWWCRVNARELSSLAHLFHNRAPQTPITHLQAARNKVLTVGEEISAQSDKLSTMPSIADRWVTENAENILKFKNGVATGYTTGIKGLDALTGGLRPRALHIIAARPSMGKTTFALNIAYNAAVKGAKVAIFSLEMGDVELFSKLVSLVGRVPARKFMVGNVNEEELDRAEDAIVKLGQIPIRIIQETCSNIAMIEDTAKRLRRQGELDILIVDYLQLVDSDKRTENRVTEVSDVTKRMKALARSTGLAVVALAQLNRAADNSPDGPTLAHLRESGSIEQDADIIVFIHRPDPRDPETYLKVDKNRHGKRFQVLQIKADDELNRWTD